MRRRRSAEDVASFQGLGLAVRHLRLERGLTLEHLSWKAEITLGTLSVIENGKAEVHWGTLRILAGALDVSPKALTELAVELAPGRSGGWWRRWTREAEELWGKRT